MRALAAVLLVALPAVAPAQQVRISVTVIDKDEHFVRNLNASHFRIQEDGVNQSVEEAVTRQETVSMGVLLDKSRSMGDSMQGAGDSLARSLNSVLDSSSPDDELFVMLFADKIYL